MFSKILFALSMVIPLSAFAQSALTESELQEILKVKIRTVENLALNSTLVDAVRQQNAQHLSMETIKRRDNEWQSTKELTDFKLSLQKNKAGEFLKNFIARNTSFNEAFLTDNQGANVATYPVTSDYWQGDEEKWTTSFNDGKGKVFVGPLKKDESTNTVAAQISAPVFDKGTKETIGVLVVGVKLSYVESKQR